MEKVKWKQTRHTCIRERAWTHNSWRMKLFTDAFMCKLNLMLHSQILDSGTMITSFEEKHPSNYLKCWRKVAFAISQSVSFILLRFFRNLINSTYVVPNNMRIKDAFILIKQDVIFYFFQSLPCTEIARLRPDHLSRTMLILGKM